MPLPFAAPVADDLVLARTVRAAFARTLEPLAVDALVVQLADGLLRAALAVLSVPCAAASICLLSSGAAISWRVG